MRVSSCFIATSNLTQYFEKNKTDAFARTTTYLEFPMHYVFNQKEWVRRVIASKGNYSGGRTQIGRMYMASPTEGERFYSRIMLNHRRGCTSFQELRCHDNVTYSSYRETALTRGLLQDDAAFEEVLRKLSNVQPPMQVRSLFATVLRHCEVSDPLILLNVACSSMFEHIS